MPKKNVDYESFQFRKASQRSDETIDQFVTRLRKLAVHCEFTNLKKELKSAVIQQCTSKRLRRYALREDDMTLDKILSKARALEASESQAIGMEESQSSVASSDSVHKIRRGQNPRRQMQQHSQPQSSMCRQCGLTWPHTRSPCPAKGKSCNKCGKPNHFAKMCLSSQQTITAHAQHSHQQRAQSSTQQPRSQVHYISTANEEKEESSSDESDAEYVFTLGHEPGKAKVPETSIEVNGVSIKVLIDTGASTDILDEAAFDKIEQTQQIELKEHSCPIYGYGSDSQLGVLGKFNANIKANGQQITTTFLVLKGVHGSLLSFATATKLGININNITSTTSTLHSDLIQQYPSMDFTSSCHPKEKWRCTFVCRHAYAQPSYSVGKTPDSNS